MSVFQRFDESRLDQRLLVPGEPWDAGTRIVAAMPITYHDGRIGAISIAGTESIREPAAAEEILRTVPSLCQGLRRIQTLNLIQQVGAVLNDFDADRGRHGESRARKMQDTLRAICSIVADTMRSRYVEVALYLAVDPTKPCFVENSATQNVPAEAELTSRSAVVKRLSVSIDVGGRSCGTLECHGSVGPPDVYGVGDRKSLLLVSTMIAQFWMRWQDETALLREISLWRGLAENIGVFNALLFSELRRDRPRDDVVFAAAYQALRGVDDGCQAACIYWRVGESATNLVQAWLENSAVAKRASSDWFAGPALGTAFRTGAQRTVSGRTGPLRESRALGFDVWWLVATPVKAGEETLGVLLTYGSSRGPDPGFVSACAVLADQIGLYSVLKENLQALRKTRRDLKAEVVGQAEAMEDLEHQLASPLLGATVRTEVLLRSAHFDSRAESQLKAIRGLVRRASRIAMTAGVYATLTKGERPAMRFDSLGVDDLLPLLIAAADDAQRLSDPKRKIAVNVNRDSLRYPAILVRADRLFLEQCLANLLDNAVKYCFADTEISVFGRASKSDLEICVASEGIPLEPTDIARALQRNWRSARARASTGEGSGIGLWIVDNLMRSMNGRLSVEPAGYEFVAALRLDTIPIGSGAR